MPMKLNVGVCRKIGQPDYGSLGASCDVQVELSDSLVFDDPDAFQRRVRQVYAACERAVDDQLGAQQQPSSASSSRTHTDPPARHNSGADAGHQNGNGAGGRQATEKQLTYIRQLAGQVKGLGVRKLESLAQTMFGKPVAGLTSLFVGKMCHSGLEAFYRHRQLGVTLEAEEVAKRMIDGWGKAVTEEGIQFASEPDEMKAKLQVVDLVTAYLAHIPEDEPRPLAVEATMEAPLGDPLTGEDFGIPLLGIVDLVLDEQQGPVIADFKTAARGGTPAEITHEIQLSSYSYLFRQLDGRKEAGLEIRSLIKTKTPRIEFHHYDARSDTHFRRLFAVVREYLDALDSGRFNFRPGFGCSMCDHRNTHCRRWCG